MKPEQQRIAIAEACGWKIAHWDHAGTPLPDYLNDLNAIHEAEGRIQLDQEARYGNYLLKIVYRDRNGIRTIWHTTAAQRAEAFLRTIGKWEE